MTELRIVCTHDALKTAEVLRRLLEAEEQKVVVSYGRQSLAELSKARAAKQNVLLIWSPQAPTTQYILDWAAQIDSTRLIEISRGARHPVMAGHAPAIDFTTWSGERGGHAWNALSQRVKDLPRPPTPKKPPPKYPALALAAISVAAVAGALFVRVHDAVRPADPAPEPDQITAQIDNPTNEGVGGPLRAVEPLSEDYLYEVTPAPSPHIATLSHVQITSVNVPDLEPNATLRDQTLLERLAEFNPLHRDDAAPPAQTPQP